MKTRAIAALLVATCATLELAQRGEASCADGAMTVHAWGTLDYEWAALGITREDAVRTGEFIPSNNALAGVKAAGGVIFATVPRWTSGVPSTLNKVVVDSESGASVLQPYPNAWFNNLSNPEGVKYVQSMEIDSHGRMWIIDVGRSNTTGTVLNGPAKVVIWHIAEDRLLDSFVLPDDIAAANGNFLNDIVVDDSRMVAYISDANRGAIVIVDMMNKRASLFEDTSTKNESVPFLIDGVPYTFNTPADGIALTPDMNWLYYTALEGLTLYRIPAEVLRTWPLDSDAAKVAVQVVGTKSSPADGMVFGLNGFLYSGGIADPDNNVWSFDSVSGGGFSQATVAENAWWADTFAFDGFGNLLFTTNNLNKFFAGEMNFDDPTSSNFCISSIFVGTTSYIGKGSKLGLK